MSRITKITLILPLVFLILLHPTYSFNLEILEPDVLEPMVFINGELTDYYNASVYDQNFVCTNGQLQIIEFQQSPEDELIVFRFSGAELTRSDINITVEPNLEPKPFIKDFNRVYKKFTLDAGCPNIITKENYYNRVKVTLQVQQQQFLRKIGSKNYERKMYKKTYEFSFLLNCDLWDVHKHFEYGYIFISIICITIVFFVSLHPRICSLVINHKPLNFQIKWKWFLLMMIFMFGVLGLIYQRQSKPRNDIKAYFGNRTDQEEKFHMANMFLKHLGLLFSLVYVYVCCSELFFEYNSLLDFLPFIYFSFMKRLISRRVLASAFISIMCYIIGIWYQNWIYYNLLSFCIAIGAIKMFRFKSLRDGFYTLLVVVISISVFTVWSYYKLARPVNDYASELSSPLFVQVPDLVNNLYKKCSWVSIYDMILPGAILAYLRDYDQNYHVGWKGVYTFTSIISFSLSCLAWIIIEALSEYNIPFCIIIYPPFILSVMLLSLYRNQFETLWYGYFHFSIDLTIIQMIQEYKNKMANKEPTVDHVFPKELLDAIKFQESRWSDSESMGLASNRRALDDSELEIWSATLGKRESYTENMNNLGGSSRKQQKPEKQPKTNLFTSQNIMKLLKKASSEKDDKREQKKLTSSQTISEEKNKKSQ